MRRPHRLRCGAIVLDLLPGGSVRVLRPAPREYTDLRSFLADVRASSHRASPEENTR